MTVNQDFPDTQCVRNLAGMLSSGGAETAENVTRYIVSSFYRNALDCIGHVSHRNSQEAFGDLFRCLPSAGSPVQLMGPFFEGSLDGVEVRRQVSLRPEDPRKVLDGQFSHHEVCIGDTKRSAVTVTAGPRVCPRRIRADLESQAIERKDRSSSGCNRVNVHHRGFNSYPGDFRIETALQFTGIMSDIGGCPPHVKGDDAVESCLP